MMNNLSLMNDAQLVATFQELDNALANEVFAAEQDMVVINMISREYYDCERELLKRGLAVWAYMCEGCGLSGRSDDAEIWCPNRCHEDKLIKWVVLK